MASDNEASFDKSTFEIQPGSAEPVLDIEPEEEHKPEFLALKCAFTTPKRGELFGGFCLIYDGTSGRVIHKALWASRTAGASASHPEQGWKEYLSALPQIGPYDKSAGDSLNAALDTTFEQESRIKLFCEYVLGDTHDLPHVEAEIRKTFERATHYFLDLKSDAELLTRPELEECGLIEPKEKPEGEGDNAEAKKEQSSDDDDEFKGTLVQCLPLVEPVWGKAASDLSPGDVLEVEIADTNEAGSTVKQYLIDTKQDSVFPICELKKKGDRIYVYLEISDEIRGMMMLTKDLKLKTPMIKTARKRTETALDDLIFFIVLSFVLLGILVFV